MKRFRTRRGNNENAAPTFLSQSEDSYRLMLLRDEIVTTLDELRHLHNK